MRNILVISLLFCPACAIGDSFEGFEGRVQYTSFDSSELYEGDKTQDSAFRNSKTILESLS